MRFLIEILFDNDDKAEINVTAKNQAEALKRVENSPEFSQFTIDKKIEKISISIIAEDTIDLKNYVLQPSQEIGYWVITDKLHNCVIKFKEKEFNNTAKVTFLFETKQIAPVELATIIRKTSEFLYISHPELVGRSKKKS